MNALTPSQLGVHPEAIAERRRIVELLDSYEVSLHAQVRAMAADRIGDPHSNNAKLEMLRLMRAVIGK